jgi:hypothetical protein
MGYGATMKLKAENVQRPTFNGQRPRPTPNAEEAETPKVES